MHELVEVVERVTGREAQALYVRAESGGVSRLVADLQQAGHWLEYTPNVDLETGLKLLLERDPQFTMAADTEARSS